LIKLEELNKRNHPTDAIIRSNLQVLCERLNKVRAAWGKPMIVTSGLRSDKQQAELIKAGKSTATKSRHLVGLAADIADPDGELGRWLLENVKLLEEVGLWCEHPDHTPGWAHLQASPPRSGRRFFKP
jgi:uncharacterized protein YcbK (DUF882 family)